MNLVFWFSLLFHLAITPLNAWFQGVEEQVITWPQPDSVLQGAVEVNAALDAAALTGYEVSFGYTGDESRHWFLIEQASQPAENGRLAVWDTTLITDGDYRLLVRVFGLDGTSTDYLVENLRVRNYSPVETIIPTTDLTLPAQTPTTTLEPSPTAIQPTATALAANPGAVDQMDMVESVLRGVGYTGLAFLIVGFYLTLKRRRPRH